MKNLDTLILIFAMFPLGYGFITALENLIRPGATRLSKSSKDWMLCGATFFLGVAGAFMPSPKEMPLELQKLASDLNGFKTALIFFCLLMGGAGIAALLLRAVRPTTQNS